MAADTSVEEFRAMASYYPCRGVPISQEEWDAGIDLERRERPPRPVRRPPRAPVWVDRPPPDGWEPPSNDCEYHYMTLKVEVEGTHTNCVYHFHFLKESDCLPHKKGNAKRKTIVALPMLEKGKRPRPSIKDRTVGAYLKRAGVSKGDKVELSKTWLPGDTVHKIYVMQDRNLVLIDFSREVRCVLCESPMAAQNTRARSLAMVDNFRFRPCCFGAPIFKSITPSAYTDVAEVWQIYYDLETTPEPDTGIHQLYMGIVFPPQQLIDMRLYEEAVRINSAEDFMKIVDTTIAVLRGEPRRLGKTSIQLVSFNGSRYDDTFLLDAYRTYVYQTFGLEKLKEVEYSERKGAMTFNTLVVEDDIEVRWTDLARFVPPTSLRNLAKSFKLTEEKGSMPFQALNDFVRKGPAAVRRSPEDGFLDCESYYGGDHEERQRSFDYYCQVVPQEKRKPSIDLDVLCERYCEQDVRVTKAAYEMLDSLYTTYLADQVPKPPEGQFFRPLCLHSLATMSGKIMSTSAFNEISWGYDSDLQEATVVCPKTEGLFFAPIGACYDYIRHSIAGGWVKGYIQGFVCDDSALPEEMKETLAAFEEKHDAAIEHNLPHDMTDIASMYPVAVTYAMPLGQGVWVEEPTRRKELFEQLLAEEDPLKIPKFFFRAQWRAPRRPMLAESTIPQRKERTNALRWTYWDDMSGTRVVTSLDAWIACRDHFKLGDPETYWEVIDIIDMLYFPLSGTVYRSFMEACAKLKTDGSAEGNELKRTAGKIAMNSGIGKLGQQVEGRYNVMGAEGARAYAQASGDQARLVSVEPVAIRGNGRRPFLQEEEYIFANKSSSSNRQQLHHAAFMYAATRLMRLSWALLTWDPERGDLTQERLPNTLYGDTDSKLLATASSSRAPASFIGSTVGVFQPELPPSLLTRPFFQVEPEKVSIAPMKAVISGVLGSKKYFVWACADKDAHRQCLKFKCNGLTRFSLDKHPCPLHAVRRCAKCPCPHRLLAFECLPCVLKMLASETLVTDDGQEGGVRGPHAIGLDPYGAPYKYPIHRLPALSLLDFVRVLVTGVSCKTVSERFDRTLSQGNSKLRPFTIRTIDQERSLNRPLLLQTLPEIVRDLPSGGRLVPFISGCGKNLSSKVGLIPAGSYCNEYYKQ